MKTQPLSVEHLSLPDHELGALILGLFITVESELHGIDADQIPHDLAVQIVQLVRDAETSVARNVAIEKALHKAANGEFEVAGRLIKQHIRDEAIDLVIFNGLIQEVRRKLKGPKAGGKKTAQIIKAEKADRNRKICAMAAEFEQSGYDLRSINSKLAQRFSLSRGQINRIRNSAK